MAFDLAGKAITYAAKSDFVRICILKKYGGLWVDATTYCTIPLDDWLEKYIQSGFFSFNLETRPKGQPDRLLSSYFLYGERLLIRLSLVRSPHTLPISKRLIGHKP